MIWTNHIPSDVSFSKTLRRIINNSLSSTHSSKRLHEQRNSHSKNITHVLKAINTSQESPLTASAICCTCIQVGYSCMQHRMALTPPSVAKETLHSYFSIRLRVSSSAITAFCLGRLPIISTKIFKTLSLEKEKVAILKLFMI